MDAGIAGLAASSTRRLDFRSDRLRLLFPGFFLCGFFLRLRLACRLCFLLRSGLLDGRIFRPRMSGLINAESSSAWESQLREHAPAHHVDVAAGNIPFVHVAD